MNICTSSANKYIYSLIQLNGQNVVGISDKEVSEIIDSAGNVVTLTVLPSYVYRHMMKK